jgi:hypothetical protein
MKKYFFIILLLISKAVTAQQYTYDNEYIGIKVGDSSKQDVIALHGETNREFLHINEEVLHYNKFNVRIQSDTNKVNKILIIDPNYIDKNGLKIGTPKILLENIFNKKIIKNYFIDKDKGLIYWFEDSLIARIQLVDELIFSPDLVVNDKDDRNVFELPNGVRVLLKTIAIRGVVPPGKIGHKDYMHINGMVEADIIHNNTTKYIFKKVLVLSFYSSQTRLPENFSSNKADYENWNYMKETNFLLPYIKRLADDLKIKLINVQPTTPISQNIEGLGTKIWPLNFRLFYYKTVDNTWIADKVNP